MSALLFLLPLLSAAGEPTLELVTLQYPPYQYQDGAETKGFVVDIVREAFRRMGRSIHVSVYPWGRSLAMAESGLADGIFTLYKTPERESKLDYSHQVLMPQAVSLFVLKGAAIHFEGELKPLAGYRFGVVRAVSYGAIFDGAAKRGDIQVSEVAASGEQNVEKLLARRFDILVSNRYGAWDIMKRMHVDGQVRELQPPVEQIPSYLAFARKPELAGLRERFDAALESMRRDGSYQRLVEEADKSAR
ncbi:amino acid ABC transporter substrate-binding protein [Chromobacterium phragmitis]|uniref:Amino acid ABC transporter substrate-binding protein n=1 Tax=Chromobacterium phragmitis TaxID=2202141 RepID=A0A344UDG8_9NEIS|nr:transporter substrate-binding domain-containing protein [Chromobacterium phragmitis]AXE31925.1 amino acid ABC transporter substrate-binding protein [Chromobacterium phragmitis]AXE33316.1 amino acid ABC transporter substrate-binding protein [Chromobacterium phragmitis]